MSGYAIAMGPCVACGRPFGFNPLRVPSLVINGTREPVCASCYERLRDVQRTNGLPVWPDPLPDAYDPVSAEEL
ncbi:MAG TPA: hypothetical protein VH539_07015 [Gemmatimonadaceae bacterium]|jgi:hypothetical protein